MTIIFTVAALLLDDLYDKQFIGWKSATVA
jgi:hypothetical protein